MTRTILVPPAFPAAALGQLKQWLAITTDAEDEALGALIRSALEICEAFTGHMLLEAECEEILPACRGTWQNLSSRPVQAILGAEGIPPEGARYPLAADTYAAELEADGSAKFRLLHQGTAGRIALRYTAGLAADWEALPEALRHGVIRLAAHMYRLRADDGAPPPPAAVIALWRPWRRYHLL